MSGDVLWGVLVVFVIVAFGVLFVLALLSKVRSDRRSDRLTATRGVPAVAEIITIEHESYDGEPRLLLTLRFAAPGIAAFDDVHRCGSADYAVGDRLAAVVDPITRNFTIATPH